MDLIERKSIIERLVSRARRFTLHTIWAPDWFHFKLHCQPSWANHYHDLYYDITNFSDPPNQRSCFVPGGLTWLYCQRYKIINSTLSRDTVWFRDVIKTLEGQRATILFSDTPLLLYTKTRLSGAGGGWGETLIFRFYYPVPTTFGYFRRGRHHSMLKNHHLHNWRNNMPYSRAL